MSTQIDAMDKLIKILQADSSLHDSSVQWVSQPPRQSIFSDFPPNCHPALVNSLIRNGITQLYLHQQISWDAIEQGKNIVITTGTASGKSLCYQMPILNTALNSSSATMLFLFPTKALAQDQLQSLQKYISPIEIAAQNDPDIPTLIPGIYDGDTPASQRHMVRNKTRLLISNPDMMNMAMLPHHTLWENFFKNMRFVVLDEIHIYRGVFGAHLVNLLRRLKRICSFYGTKPQFIMTSATIANPEEHARTLTEDDVVWVQENGSPQGNRHFVMVNPPIIHPELGLRQNPTVECIQLTSDLLAFNLQTLIFLRTRRAVEVLYKQLVEKFTDVNIQSYRSGYLPAERRKIEGQLRSGETRVVVATNALELGIDIGGINCVILVGYPGTIAATIQQAGRAGRTYDTALAVLIASQNPLDQFLMKHPDYLLGRPPEQARCDPNNLLILLAHLRCATFELPFQDGEGFGSASNTLVQGLLMFLVGDNQVHHSENSFFWAADKYPADTLNLRTTAGNVVSLKSISDERISTIGSVDAPSALWMVHPDAVYLHQGDSYIVRKLDLENGQALLEPANVDYYTEPRNETEVIFANSIQVMRHSGVTHNYGDIRLSSKVVGYKKIRWSTLEILSTHDLDLPPNTLDTTGYWFSLDQSIVENLREADAWKSDKNDYGKDWDKIRRSILQRDGFRCSLCGTAGTQESMHVHHKNPFRTFTSPSEANKPTNLITLCPTCHHRVEVVVRTRSGLSGLRYVLLNLAPLFVMCDPTDLGSLADPKALFSDGLASVMIYDQAPGGIGLSQALFQSRNKLLENCLELVKQCNCENGCPGCVGPAGENGIGGKPETLTLLEAIVES